MAGAGRAGGSGDRPERAVRREVIAGVGGAGAGATEEEATLLDVRWSAADYRLAR